MNKRQEQQIVDYYSTTDRYIRSDRYSDSNQTVFTKENDRYQWLVLEQKSQHDVEVRQTDSHGTITTRDNYELTRNIPKCVGVERLCKDANMQIPFTADEINLIYQFGEQSKAETCAHLSAILPQIKDNDTKQIVCSTLDCQHFFRQIFLGYFSDIVQAFDTLRKNVCGDDYTSLHNPIVLSSVLPAYGMFHSIQILFL